MFVAIKDGNLLTIYVGGSAYTDTGHVLDAGFELCCYSVEFSLR